MCYVVRRIALVRRGLKNCSERRETPRAESLNAVSNNSGHIKLQNEYVRLSDSVN